MRINFQIKKNDLVVCGDEKMTDLSLAPNIILVSIVEPYDFSGYMSPCCNLFIDDVQVSNQIFRAGGFTYGFKDEPYCQLLLLESPRGPCKQVIINRNGEIVWTENGFNNILYLTGVIAKEGNHSYINLLTKKVIVEGYSSLRSKNFIFVENSYNKNYPLGVYKIETKTGEYEIFN